MSTRQEEGPPDTPPDQRDHIFISYSHHDHDWLQHLQIHLAPLLRGGISDAWDDQRIKPGDNWKLELERALGRARVAVLLVSPWFLASDFIVEQELPRMLAAADRSELTILWIAVSSSSYKQTDIARFQALNNPDRPLDMLSAAELNSALVEICARIQEAWSRGSPPSPAHAEGREPRDHDPDRTALEATRSRPRPTRRSWLEPLRRRGRWLLLLLLLGVVIAVGAAAFSGRHRSRSLARAMTEYTACEAASLDDVFESQAAMKILVTRFHGKDGPSQGLGAEIGVSLATVLPEYVRQNLAADAQRVRMTPENFQVEYLPCYVTSHAEARRVGEAAGADLVFWGQASCNVARRNGCTELVSMATAVLADRGGRAQGAGGVDPAPAGGGTDPVPAGGGSGQVPAAEGSFKTSMTVVRWKGLSTVGDEGVRLSDLLDLQNLDFPQIASPKPLALFDFVMGMFAFEAGYQDVATKYFERSQSDLFAGAIQSAQVYRYIGSSYLAMGQVRHAVAALEKGVEVCGDGKECWMLKHVALTSAYSAAGEYEKAIPLTRKVAEDERKLGHPGHVAKQLYQLGELYRRLRRFDEAELACEEAARIFQQRGETEDLRTAYRCLADIARGRRKPEAALSLYGKALELPGDGAAAVDGRVQIYIEMARAYRGMGKEKEAAESAEKAIELLETDAEGRCACHFDQLGWFFYELELHSEAVRSFQKAGQWYARRSSRVKAADSLNVAFQMALNQKLFSLCPAIIEEVRRLEVSELRAVDMEAQLLSRTDPSGSEAAEAYRRLERLAAEQGSHLQPWPLRVRAGLERLKAGPAWGSCAGLLVTGVKPGAAGDKAGIQVGDVLLKYNDACLRWHRDLAEEKVNRPKNKEIQLEVWKQGRSVRLTLPEAEPGLDATAF